jgi:hypothetical protein
MYWSGNDLEAHGKKKKPIAIATRCSANHLGTAAAGTVVGNTFRYAHVMKTEATDLQLVFANFYPTVSSESSNANDIIVSATIEYNGQVTRLFFDGAKTKTLSQGGFATTDPIFRDIPVGATFYTRTWISVPVDGGTYPQTILTNFALGDSKGTGDSTLTPGALTNVSEQGFGPVAIVGVPVKDNAVAFALYGDSIVAYGDGLGWPVETVQANYGYSIMSKASSTVTTMISNTPNAYRLRLAKYFTHAIVNFGTNDFDNTNTYAQQEGWMLQLWKALSDMGLEVYQSTVMPRTTGNWTTIAGQTTYNTNSYNSKRVLFNDKLRRGDYPVMVLDVADAIETFRNSGIWKPNFTDDGIHPLPLAKDAVTSSISLGL